MLLSVIYKCMLFLPTVIFMSFYMYLDQDFHFFLTYLHSMRNIYSTIFFFFFFKIKMRLQLNFPLKFDSNITSAPFSKLKFGSLYTSSTRCWVQHCRVRSGIGVQTVQFMFETVVQVKFKAYLKERVYHVTVVQVKFKVYLHDQITQTVMSIFYSIKKRTSDMISFYWYDSIILSSSWQSCSKK